MPLPKKMSHGRLRQGSEPRDVDKHRVALRPPFEFKIYVAGSRAYDEEINRPKFIEKGFNCSGGFFAFHKINSPDNRGGAAVSSYLFQKIHPPGRKGKPPALMAQFTRQSFAYSG
jgi:hypothetical protein